jgi:hypothetical protein
MCNYPDPVLLVVLIRGIERSNVHYELKAVARLHKHLVTSLPTTSSANLYVLSTPSF